MSAQEFFGLPIGLRVCVFCMNCGIDLFLRNQHKRQPVVRFAPKKKYIDISTVARAPLLLDPTDIPSTTSASSTDRSNTMGSSSVVSAKDVEHSNETQGAASNVYESVKDAWTWGRHETPFSPLLGLAEGLTSQTIGLFGTDLKCLDDALKPCVADLDEHVLKPTLSNVSSFLADRTKPADTDEVVEQPRVENKTEETAGAS